MEHALKSRASHMTLFGALKFGTNVEKHETNCIQQSKWQHRSLGRGPVSGFLEMCHCDIAITLSGLLCVKLLIKIRGQETILCPSRDYRELPENKFGYPGYQRMSFSASPTHIMYQDSKPVILRQQRKGRWWHFPCTVQQVSNLGLRGLLSQTKLFWFCQFLGEYFSMYLSVYFLQLYIQLLAFTDG